MKKRENSLRYFEIDALRGLAMLSMVIIHTNAYFRDIKIADFLWDANQFAVPVFIFCSAYIFFKKQRPFNHVSGWFFYIKQRFIRLLVPYYIFAGVYIFLTLLKEPTKITASYLTQSFFLVGGIDINWLILLFLIFSFIMPVLAYVAKKSLVLFCLLALISALTALLLVFFPFSFNYRLIMWVPWLTIVFMGWFFVRYENRKILWVVGPLISLLFFLSLRAVQRNLGHSLIMFDNKYPPNLYHLSYGALAVFILFFLAKKGAFNFLPLKKVLEFLSLHSFPVYFIHWIIIYALTLFFKIKFQWVGFFLTVLFLTLMVQVVIQAFIFFLRYTGGRLFEYWRARAD